MKKILLALTLLCLSVGAFAQSDSLVKVKPNYNLKFSVFPGHNYRIKIDGVLMPSSNRYEVGKGTHYVQIWAPNYKTFDTTIVVEDEKVLIHKELGETQRLIDYKENMAISKKHFRGKVGSSLGILFFGSMMYVKHNKVGEANLEQIKAQNSVDFETLDYTSAELSDANTELRSHKNQRAFFAVGLGLCTANLIRQLVVHSKHKRPKMPKDNSFTLDGTAWVTPNGMIYSGLTLKF